jgi:tRNA pseudouridine32 synthase / 23S rRNA pseudouridine746 synthase
MSRARKPTPLPTLNGVSPSCVALPPGAWTRVLDFMVERLPAVSREQWQQRLHDGQVFWSDARPVAPDAPYRANTHVFYYRQIDDETPLPYQASILFQDDHLIVADKPHFMPVTPSGRYVQQSLLVQLKRLTGIDGLSPIHRIDRETAGLVLLSVRPSERNAYQAMFRERSVHKTYHALAPFTKDLVFPLTRRSRLISDQAFFRSIETDGPPNSETHIAVLQQLDTLALYQLQPVTGQRHQLRVHMNALGLPIVGDQFYPHVRRTADEVEDFKNPLQLLAQSIQFIDPVTQQARHFCSQLALHIANDSTLQ